MRLQEIKNMHLENRSTELVKELSICLQRLPDFPAEWTIVKEAPLSQSMKEKNSLSSKVKRKSNEEYTYLGAKKQKLDFRTLDFKKILKKFKQVLIKSSEFYKKAGLVKEENKIIECLTIINLCQDNLKTQIQSPVHQKDSTIKTQEFPTKSLALPKDKMRQYQTTFSTRLAYKFFNTYLPEDNVQTAKPIIKNISP